MSLSASIQPYTEGLSPENKRQALRAVSSFILLGDYRTYREQIKSLPKRHHTLFYKDVMGLLKSSFECRNIWRTVYYRLKHPDKKTSVVAKKFYVPKESLKLVWGSLLSEDKEAVRERARGEMDFGLLTKEEMEVMVKSLTRYCGRVSYLKLRFLADNDHAYDLADFKNELLAKGIQTVRAYEHTRDLKMIENYAKASIQNYAINLIQYYTSESRACVKNTTEGCGTCVFCLSDMPQKCKEAVASYGLTAVSLDLPSLSSSVPSTLDIESKVGESLLVNYLKEGSPDTTAKIIDLVFGKEVDEDFELWLFSHEGVTVDYLLKRPKRYVKTLCSYLGVSNREVQRALRTKYQNYISKAV